MRARRYREWAAAVLTATALACGGDGASGPSAPAVATVDVTPATAQLNVGESRQLAAAPKTSAGLLVTGKVVTWSSASALVASVDASGMVRAVGAGATTISATVDGKVGSASVTVAVVPVASVVVTPSSGQVFVQGTLALQASTLDAQGAALSGRAVAWSSSNAAVATVSSTGVVSGLAVGTATITASSEGKSAVAQVTVVPNTGVTFALTGRVVDAPAGAASAGARVTALDANALVLATTTADAAGNWALTGFALGSSVGLTVSAVGFVSTTVAPFAITAAVTVETVPLVRTGATAATVTGRARDASTNQPITTGIAVELRDGLSATLGLALQSTTTAADGSYSFSNVVAGTYTVTMRGAGYVQSSRTVAAAAGTTTASQDLTLSASATANQWRVVLTWVGTGRDLDLYLTLPGAGSSRQQIYFLQPGNCAAAPFACLDRDASAAPGPETMTISQVGTGTYRFYVQNYNAPSSAADSTLMFSGAQVRVFRGATQVATYQVPQQGGTLWTVFELDGASGNLTPKNTMGAGAPGDPTMQLVAQDLRLHASDKRDKGLRLP